MGQESFPNLTPEQSARSAHNTIKGYLYQFERSIIQILEAQNGAEVQIEGIEDIDIAVDGTTTATQIKHYASKSATPSTLKEALKPMVESVELNQKCKYILYMHVGSGEVPEKLNLDWFEEQFECKAQESEACKKVESGGEAVKTDNPAPEKLRQQIEWFAENHKIIQASSFEDQNQSCKKALQEFLDVDDYEVQTTYLPVSIDLVQRLSIKSQPHERRISRDQFLTKIKAQQNLQTHWRIANVGEKRFLSQTRQDLEALRYNSLDKRRAIFIDAVDGNRQEIAELCIDLANHYNEGKRLARSHPWVVMLVGDHSNVAKIKSTLIESGIKYFDGYEDYEFNQKWFIEGPLKTQRANGSLKASSYAISIARMTTETFRIFESENWKILNFSTAPINAQKISGRIVSIPPALIDKTSYLLNNKL